MNPPTKLNYEVIREFYANALPMQGQEYPFTTMVQGRIIFFDRNAINDYLGNPLTLEEGEIDAYSKCVVHGNWDMEKFS